jgi:hypothetical protein
MYLVVFWTSWQFPALQELAGTEKNAAKSANCCKPALTGDSGRCRSVFRGMPITDSALMAITIPG